MKRSLALTLALLCCLCLPLAAVADGLAPAPSIAGEQLYPDGATADTARYVLRYEYPQFEATAETDRQINAFYQALSEDARLMPPGEEAMSAEPGMPAYTELGYQVTRNDERYLSVVLSSRALLGNAEGETISANTFARDGLYAGQPITLSQALGLEQQGDELSEGQSLAERLAYKLVWQIVERASQNADAGYLDGLSQQSLYAVFSPETDFYMDADGNIVFFIQPGEIAGEVVGILTFPFAPAELMSAVNEE